MEKRFEFECKKKCGIYPVSAQRFYKFLTKWLAVKLNGKLKKDEVVGARMTFANGCPDCEKTAENKKGQLQIIKLKVSKN